METTTALPPTPWQTQAHLANVGCFLSLAAIAERSPAERIAAVAWATAVSEAAEPQELLERPEWLPGRNSAEIEVALGLDLEHEGGRETALQRYHDEWREREQTFGDMLVALGDEDLIEDLASVGVTLEPTENDGARLQVFADRLLQSAHEDQTVIDESKDAEALQVEMIRRRYEEARGAVIRRSQGTLALARRLAEFLHYGKRKSLELPHGKIGFTDYGSTAKVDDAVAALAWAKDNLPGAVTYVAVLDKKAIAQHVRDTGEDVPGVIVEPPRRDYYARPR